MFVKIAIEFVSVDAEHAKVARSAFSRFGQDGTGRACHDASQSCTITVRI
jgi:uncharacterized protein with PIN domain